MSYFGGLLVGLKWRGRGSKTARRPSGFAPSAGPPEEVKCERHDQDEQNGRQRHRDYVSHVGLKAGRLHLATISLCYGPYEVLSEVLNAAAENGELKHHPVLEKPHLAHPGLADDLSVFLNGDGAITGELYLLSFDRLEILSGSKLNPARTAMFAAGVSKMRSKQNLLGLWPVNFILKYFGRPFGLCYKLFRAGS
ncbi:hypothetical protein NL676_001165 [Syzygium grande]|nr:hypothetical protein NL676_001165 [Syzygium grande]